MDLPLIISVVCQYSLRQFIPGTCITCDPTGVADSLFVTKYSSILHTRRSNIELILCYYDPENLGATTDTLEREGSNFDAIEDQPSL